MNYPISEQTWQNREIEKCDEILQTATKENERNSANAYKKSLEDIQTHITERRNK
jgi:hypothetical protein